MLLVDKALEGRTNLIAGANKEDYHLKNLTPGKDFIRRRMRICARSRLARRVRIAASRCGSIPRLRSGTSSSWDTATRSRWVLRVLDKNGKEVMPIMGCYGIGIERILTAAVEQGNDDNGFWLPASIAPFEIVVAPVNVKDETVQDGR